MVKLPTHTKQSTRPYPHLPARRMLLLQSILKCPSYKFDDEAATRSYPGGATQDEPPAAAELRRASAADLRAQLPIERRSRLVTHLVQSCLPLSAEQLESWEADSESFHADMAGGALLEHLQPSAVQLYLTLLEQNRAELAPVVLRIVESATAAATATTAAAAGGGADAAAAALQAALALEAAYRALGEGAYELHDFVDFPSFCRGQLFPAFANRGLHAKLVRRVACWLIGTAWRDFFCGSPLPRCAVLPCAALRYAPLRSANVLRFFVVQGNGWRRLTVP